MPHPAFVPTLGALAVCALAAAVPLSTHAAPANFECGGIGRISQDAMVTASHRRDLMLTFGNDVGAYLADVDVTITSPSGEVLVKAHCPGPLMLVDLPSVGTVHVQASYRGQVQRKPITIGSRTARVAFIWNVG